MPITVPAPTLPATAPMTEPLKVTLSGIQLAGGTTAGEADVVSAALLVFRGFPGSGELWDDVQKQWRAAPSDDELKQQKGLFAVFRQGGAPAWEATLVAIGQKDGAGADVYAPAVSGTPSYFVRALVKVKTASGEEAALSPASGAITFADAGANSKFQTQFDTPTTKPDAAHKVRMQLKGDALQPAGYLEIRAQPNFEVEIANCDSSGNVLAKMLLVASGEIRLTPGSGARVIIEGDAETNRLLYSPSGGGAKQWLA